MRAGEWFRRGATLVSDVLGTTAAFLVALGLVLLWALSGPLLAFSDTWQLIINTSTSILTFLMVFIIQYTQNRDTRAIRLKLDELLRADRTARKSLIDLDRLSDKEIERLEEEFRAWRKHHAAGEGGTASASD